MATRSSSNKGQATARESTLRNRQKAAFDGRSTNVQPAAINTKDNTQTIRRIPGLPYGEQKTLIEQQEAAPLPKTARESTLRQAQQEGMQRRGMKPPAIDVFASTDRKSEPVTAGLPFGPGVGPTEPVADDPDMLLRAIYSVYPDPLLLRLLRK